MADPTKQDPRDRSWWVVYCPDEQEVLHMHFTREEAQRQAEGEDEGVGLMVGRLVPVSEVRQVCVEVERGS